jgi:predicted secreted hydrolase
VTSRRAVGGLRLGLAGAAVAFTAIACTGGANEESDLQTARDERLELTTLLSGDAEGFARAVDPRRFEFPRDHGPHPDFRTEWWYVTGNLEASGGGRFGYQLTFFRNAISADEPSRTSQWATRQVYMAHLALTDVAGGRFYAVERFYRGAVGLAGAELRPFRVWLGDWRLTGDDAPPPFRIQADAGDFALDLDLSAIKPLVLQGEQGLSRKGGQPGNASYYYAFTRLATEGQVRVGDEELKVEGSSWLDREWSTSVLEEGQIGWDWFALQFDDGTDLMVYQVRRQDGSPDQASSGSSVGVVGEKRGLRWHDFELEVIDWWRSSESGTRYPSGWRIRVPAEKLDVRIRPVLREQELRLSVTYWEGAVDVEGSRGDAPVTGRGYVELTGYGPGSSED